MPFEKGCRGLFTRVRGKKGRSAKFTVASSPSDLAATTRQQHVGTPFASNCGDLVLFVTLLCIKGLRLIT
jgi:hypothetical protein